MLISFRIELWLAACIEIYKRYRYRDLNVKNRIKFHKEIKIIETLTTLSRVTLTNPIYIPYLS